MKRLFATLAFAFALSHVALSAQDLADTIQVQQETAVAIATSDSASLTSPRLTLEVPDPSMYNVVDTMRIDSASIDNPTWMHEVRPKHYFLAGAEVVGANILFHLLTRYVAQEDYAKISFHSIGRNFRKGFKWDNDRFETNLYSHPYQGSLYFNCARQNGLNFWESAPFALFGSSIWEMFMETQPPSTNDIIATPLGGMALGEMSYRVSSLMLDNSATGFERVVRELFAMATNPVRGVRRIISGEAWHRGRKHVDEYSQVPFHFVFNVGYGMLSDQDVESDKNRHIFSTELSFLYNNPFTISGKVPFEMFTFDMALNFSKDQPRIGQVKLRAPLWGKNNDFKNGSEIFWGIFQNFNYYNTEALRSENSKVPFRFAETVSYGPGIIYRFPNVWNNTLVVTLQSSAIILGGSLSDHYNFQERDYDLGSGYSLSSSGLWRFGSRFSLFGTFEHYHLFTWKGYEKKDWENIDPNYLNVQGATGNAWMHIARLRATVGLYRGLGMSIEGSWYQRNTHYKYFDDVKSRTAGFRILLSYQL